MDLDNLVQRTADELAAERVGVVIAAVAGGTTEFRAAGRMGGDHQGPPEATTLFEIGSVTKVFTALALARLVTAGTLHLDEPLAGLLPAGASVPCVAAGRSPSGTWPPTPRACRGCPRACCCRRCCTHPSPIPTRTAPPNGCCGHWPGPG